MTCTAIRRSKPGFCINSNFIFTCFERAIIVQSQNTKSSVEHLVHQAILSQLGDCYAIRKGHDRLLSFKSEASICLESDRTRVTSYIADAKTPHK